MPLQTKPESAEQPDAPQVVRFNIGDRVGMTEFWEGESTRTAIMPAIKEAARPITSVPRRLFKFVSGQQRAAERRRAEQDAERRDHLQMLGALALVSDFPYGQSGPERHSGMAKVISFLEMGRVLQAGHIVSVQPVTHETTDDKQRRLLLDQAKSFTKSISITTKMPRGDAFMSGKLIEIHGGRPAETSRAVGEAIDEGTIYAERRKQKLERDRKGYIRPPVLIIFTHQGLIAHALPGVTHDEVARMGGAMPYAAQEEELPENKIWRPLLSIPLPVPVPDLKLLPQVARPHVEKEYSFNS